jgi:hypothetical protein
VGEKLPKEEGNSRQTADENDDPSKVHERTTAVPQLASGMAHSPRLCAATDSRSPQTKLTHYPQRGGATGA